MKNVNNIYSGAYGFWQQRQHLEHKKKLVVYLTSTSVHNILLK